MIKIVTLNQKYKHNPISTVLKELYKFKIKKILILIFFILIQINLLVIIKILKHKIILILITTLVKI